MNLLSPWLARDCLLRLKDLFTMVSSLNDRLILRRVSFCKGRLARRRNGLHRPVLRFRETRRACTGQSQPTFCPGVDICGHSAPVCSCCLWLRQPSHSPIAPVQVNSASADPPRKHICCNHPEDFESTNNFYVHRDQIDRQKILVRHQNDRHRRVIPAVALR